MTRSTVWRLLSYVVLLIAALAILAPFLPAAFLRGSAEAALSRSLNRPVRIGDIGFTFFPAGPVPGPGFAIEDVTIHEDPRAGIEPFAHVPELGASIRVLSLLTGRLEISGINLGEASINLVKNDQDIWNVQYLLKSLKDQDASIPALRMRGGRVNFKFGDTKSVFFFSEADFDVDPLASGALDIRFSGAPSRSDHTQQDFGRLFVTGAANAASDRQELDFAVELQRSSLEETMRLMDPQGFGVHGVLAMTSRLRGTTDQLAITGQLSLGDVHRWDLLPESGQAWQLPFTGTLNLRDETLHIQNDRGDGVFGLQFEARNYLSEPEWSASADFATLPLATLFEIARHMGSTLPEAITVDGAASGSATYNQRTGLTGALRISGGTLKLPQGEPIQSGDASVRIEQGSLHLAPARLIFSPSQAAQLEGSVQLTSPHALDLRFTTRGLSNGALRSFGLAPLPMVTGNPSGTWSGWARYQNDKWTGAIELSDSEIHLPDLAEPVTLDSATLSLAANRLTISRMQGRVGETEFSGSYEERRKGPPRFAVMIPEVNAEEWERLLAPLLARAGPSFLSRTLRLRSTAPPAWLATRQAEGAISIGSVTAGAWTARDVGAQLAWDGPKVHLSGVTAKIEAAVFDGDLDIDLTSPVAHYALNGALNNIRYRGGLLTVTGAVEADGSGAQLLETAHGEGTASGRGIVFAPGAAFRTVQAGFRLQPVGQGARWQLSDIEATQGPNVLTGSGASSEEGPFVLDLTQGDRAVRYSGTLFGPVSPAKQ